MGSQSTSACTITHDVAARLIGVTPAELTGLVNDGQVRRADKNAYSLPVLVLDYSSYLKSLVGFHRIAKNQAELAEIMDLSDRSVREFLDTSGLDHKKNTMFEIVVAYERHLREMAAGRGGEGAVGELAAERARLAREQADKIAMQNAVTRGELAPVALIEEVLTKAASKVAGILDAIPGMVRRRVQQLTADDIDLIAGEVAKARNTVAAMSLADLNERSEEAEAPDHLDMGVEVEA